MPIHVLSITTKLEEYKDLQSQIELKLVKGNNYIADFYMEEPDTTIINNEENIIINGEYALSSSVLKEIDRKYPNFKPNYPGIQSNFNLWWIVISEENNEISTH